MSQNLDRELGARRRLGGWPLSPSLFLALLFLLAGCAASGEGQRKASLSECGYPCLLLKLDEAEEMGGDSTCISRRVSSTEVVGPVRKGPGGESGRWTERWIVDRCGTPIPYLVKFARAADGDLDVHMQLEPLTFETTPVPGATLADLILQRDTLGFLSQRDFAAAGPGGTCDGRKVLNTEIVEPLKGAAVEGDRPVGGQWVERWTLRRLYSPLKTEEKKSAAGSGTAASSSTSGAEKCGEEEPIRYLVHYTTTPTGTTFTVEQEPQDKDKKKP